MYDKVETAGVCFKRLPRPSSSRTEGNHDKTQPGHRNEVEVALSHGPSYLGSRNVGRERKLTLE